MTLVLILIAVVVLAVALHAPLRRAVLARMTRPAGLLRARAGIQTPRAVAQQAVREIKARAAVTVQASFLPTNAVVALGTADYSRWQGQILHTLQREIAQLLDEATKPDPRSRRQSSFRLMRPPSIEIVSDEDLAPGQVAVSAWFDNNAVDEITTAAITTEGSTPLEQTGPMEPPPSPALLLLVTFPDGEERVYPLPEGRLTVGRGPDADLRLDHPSISRRHATLDVRPMVMEVSDLQSRNGTWLVGGGRISGPPEMVGDGATLRFSDAVLARVRAVSPHLP